MLIKIDKILKKIIELTVQSILVNGIFFIIKNIGLETKLTRILCLERSIDIDNIIDFELAKIMFKKKKILQNG